MRLTTYQKQQISAKVQDYLNIYHRLRGKSFPMPPIFYYTKGTNAGFHQAGTLHFNECLASENFQHYMEDTIGHETAHYIQRLIYPHSKAHGIEWKNVMRVLGLKPIRCHNLDVSNVISRVYAKHKVHCECGTFEVTMRFVNSMYKVRCRRCKEMYSLGPKPVLTKDILNFSNSELDEDD